MSRPPKPPIFLQRANYRQRRIRDAARLLPFVGLMLWAIPLTWGTGEGNDAVGASGVIYIFGVWVALIILAAILSNLIRGGVDDETTGDRRE